MMFDGGSDRVVTRLKQSKKGEVVCLRTAAGENHFRRAAAEQGSHRFARAFDCGARLLPMMMDRRGIAEVFGKIRPHSFEHLRQKRCGGVIVKVDPTHDSFLFYAPVQLGWLTIQRVNRLTADRTLQAVVQAALP